MLGSDDAALAGRERAVVVLLVQEAVAEEGGGDSEGTADAEREEDETRPLGVKGIDRAEDVREGGEEGKQDAEVKGDVQAQEADDGFGEEHMHRPDQGDRDQET